MKQVIKFELHKETEIPQEIIDDAPKQGPFDDHAAWVLQNYDVQVSLANSIAYLKSFGAWELSELQDLEENKARIIWTAVMGCIEQGDNYFYMGE